MKHIYFGREDRRVMLRASERRAGEEYRGLTIKHVWHFKSVKHPPNVWETLIFTNGTASCNCKGWVEYRVCWHTNGRPLPRWSGVPDFAKADEKARKVRRAKKGEAPIAASYSVTRFIGKKVFWRRKGKDKWNVGVPVYVPHRTDFVMFRDTGDKWLEADTHYVGDIEVRPQK